MNTINSITTSMKDNLQHFKDNPQHFEILFYGPHNTLLSHLFPHNCGFIVKPQQQLQAQVIRAPNTTNPNQDPNQDHSSHSSQSAQLDDSTYSLDSNGQQVTTGDGDLLPDFGVSVRKGPGQHSPFLTVGNKMR